MQNKDEIIDNKFQILKSLGVGERAKIFLVLNKTTQKKNILKSFTQTNNQENTLHVNLTKSINLIEIVKIINVGTFAGRLYYTMPYVPCTSLYETVHSHHPNPIIKTSKEINYALSFFLNIICYLVKNKLCWQFHPRHIMITENGKFFLTGLAYPIDELKGVHFPDLTLGLMDECFPPEILNDSYCKADSYYQYTVASIILSLLTGQRYSERNKQKMLTQITNNNKTKLALAKALNNNPQYRHQSFDEFYRKTKPNSIFTFL